MIAVNCTLESFDWSQIMQAFLLREYHSSFINCSGGVKKQQLNRKLLFMLLLEKITHSYLCYKLDKHSVLKPFVTYSSPSTAYSINMLVLHQPYSIPFFEMKCALMIPRILSAIPCYRHYIHKLIFWKLISLTNLFCTVFNL